MGLRAGQGPDDACSVRTGPCRDQSQPRGPRPCEPPWPRDGARRARKVQEKQAHSAVPCAGQSPRAGAPEAAGAGNVSGRLRAARGL